MDGWSYDYLLSLDDTNCKQRGLAAAAAQPSIDAAAKQLITTKGAAYTDFFAKHGSNTANTCSYVNWAYIESVDL